MKTHNRHLIILVTLAALMLGLGNWGWGQEKAGAWAGTLNKDKTYILVAKSSGKFTVDEKLNSTGIITPGETEYDYIGDINVARLGDAAVDKSRVIIKYTSKDFEPIKFNGLWKYELEVNRGIPFELSVEAPSDRVKPTLQRYPGYVSFFMWFPEERYITNQYASSIKGDATTGARFIIDGGCGMKAPEMEGFTDYSVNPVSGGTQANEPLIFFASGMIKMKDVTIQNNWSNTGGSIAQTGRASAILFECPHTDNERKTLLCEMDNCIIDGCYSGDAGAAISVYNINPGSYLKMNNCTVQNCFANGAGNSKGGIVRMGGQSGGYNLNTCYLEATNCTFKDNYNRHKGGAICWPCTSNNANTGLTLKSCTFTNNHGRYEGGAIFCPYLALEDCTIQDNKVYNINSSSFELGGGIQCYGPSNGLTGNYIVMSGVMVVKDNQQVASDGSTKPSDVCLDPTGDRVVHIGSTGLDCGSCIGFYQAQIHYGSGGTGYDDIAIAYGTAAQCLKAYRNHFFFDDEDVCDVFNTTASPYYDNTSSGTLFFVRKTIAETDSGLNSWHNHTASTSSDCTIEGGFVTEVKSAAGLAYFSKDVLTKDYSGKTVNLTADINLSGHNWEPIGCRDCNSITSKVFKGTFDGQGHTITGLTCPYPYSNVGLFGAVDGTVKNLFVVGGSLSSSNVDNMGGLVGDLQGGTISNSGASCALTGGNKTVIGGLVGLMEGGTVQYCTASGTLTHPSNNFDGDNIAGGLVGRTTSESTSTIHSCSAMAEMYGYTMGGIVGILGEGCALYNSYANPQFYYRGSTNSYYVGGLVGTNTGSPSSSITPTNPGTVQNCYVRFSRTGAGLVNSPGGCYFGRLAGRAIDNTAVSSCYWPNGTIGSGSGEVPNRDKYHGANLTTSCYQYNTTVVAPYLYSHTVDFTLTSDASKNLLDELNSWVGSSTTYSKWKRTTAGGYSSGAGNINGDYPIHKYSGYTCAASTDGVNIDYAASLDVMLTRHTSDATINLYANDNTSKATGSNVMVYIDENISLLQSDPSKDITAYTCQTMRKPGSSYWHDASSSLKQSYIGFTYNNSAPVPYGYGNDNPCSVRINSNNDESLFPSDLPNLGSGYPDLSHIGLFCFYEPEYHWINLKRATNSHWHMNAHEVPINYNGNGLPPGNVNGNETYLVPGKGYIINVDKEQLLQNKGVLNNGNVTLYNVTKTDGNAWAGRLGYNLLGNPYQSYLDFEKFLNDGNGTTNTALWSGSDAYYRTYAVFDPAQNTYLQYKSGASSGSNTASQYINMHQGFFIKRTGIQNTAKFTNYMRTNTAGTGFRDDEQPAFPLINLSVTDDEGGVDIAVLELDREAEEGSEKMLINGSKGWIYLHHGGENYGVLFRSEVEDYQPLWFEASEAGTYTLRWETANGEFDELTLIDNITGSQTDMLSRDSYVFEANPDQYASRFKIVIGDYKDIEEHDENGPSTGSGIFAFRMGDELVVNGEGHLEMMDMLGRIVRTEELKGSQSTVSLPKTAGVYVLRLTSQNGTKTQKIVVE